MIGQVLRAKISVEIKFRHLLSFCSRKNGKTRKIKTWLILGSINFQNNFSKRSTREISLLPKSFFKFYSSSKQKYFIFTIYILQLPSTSFRTINFPFDSGSRPSFSIRNSKEFNKRRPTKLYGTHLHFICPDPGRSSCNLDKILTTIEQETLLEIIRFLLLLLLLLLAFRETEREERSRTLILSRQVEDRYSSFRLRSFRVLTRFIVQSGVTSSELYFGCLVFAFIYPPYIFFSLIIIFPTYEIKMKIDENFFLCV